VINWLKLGWEALRFGWKQRHAIKETVEGLADGEPETPGTPLSHKDVDYIEGQINRATEHKVKRGP
jgi:hypothetical protein